MNSLSINVQGFGDLNKRRWVHDLCNRHKVNFLALQETKLLHVDLWKIHQTWGLWTPNDVRIMWIVVYAPHNLSCKIALWSSLANLIANWCRGLVIMGDFNKVDKFLISESFREVFPNVTRAVLEKGIPNHRLILLKEFEASMGIEGFFKCMLDVESRITCDNTNENTMLSEAQRVSLRITYDVRRNWLEKGIAHKLVIMEVFHDLRASSKTTAKGVGLCVASSHTGNHREDDFMLLETIRRFLGIIESKYLSSWKGRPSSWRGGPKAKVKWAIEGDENTSFFHGTLKKKRRQLAIRGILKNGESIEDPLNVKAEFLTHFSNRFQHSNGIPPSLDGDMPNLLSSRQSDYLETHFLRDEIKQAIWDCGGDRALGPDGFTFKFFTTFWDLIKADAIRFVQEFFLICYFLKGCNSSFIALILKVSNVKFVTDFRPISLIGCQYKIIDKLLANRLNTVIGSCISSEQSAFIKGINIINGPLVLNEDFLDLVMVKLGFSIKWHTWIFGYLRNARSSILVNRSPTCEFEIFKGLRQGDPLSPFFFILATEGLHFLTCKAEMIGLFKGASFCQDNMSVSHLIYADDVIFLGVGVSDEEVSNLAKVIGCRAAKFPLKYLRVPVGCNMAKYSNWNAIIQKFSFKLLLWKACLLSVGGRLSLIKSVLGNIPTYYMSIYMMPVSVQKKLESMRNNFFYRRRFRREKKDLGEMEKMLSEQRFGRSRYRKNIWAKHGSSFQMDVEIGNGVSCPFWEDIWCGNQPLKLQFPRIYQLDSVKECFIMEHLSIQDWVYVLRRYLRGGAEMSQFIDLQSLIQGVVLSDKSDTWQWSLGISNGYSVASVVLWLIPTLWIRFLLPLVGIVPFLSKLMFSFRGCCLTNFQLELT
ncbi:putative RNA-directed DNA polymerase, eukaryota, reverse transcriptase zinc-binding domain protein [Tanacetum coccineum]|uniref:RNA-directed DNA polymerase, eukaryota, reverse transcriptase zinc-binding domain protein n=1 Tax=Tanacetum coccineum TaxID=301880 RepID=A0ABQ5FC98_9ASTR